MCVCVCSCKFPQPVVFMLFVIASKFLPRLLWPVVTALLIVSISALFFRIESGNNDMYTKVNYQVTYDYDININ